MHSVQCPWCEQLIRRPLSLLSLALCPSCGAPLPQRRHLVSLLHDVTDGRSLFMVLANDRETEGFSALIRFRQGKAELEALGQAPAAHPPIDEEEAEAVAPVGKRVAGGVA